jgi:hypothetical protein
MPFSTNGNYAEELNKYIRLVPNDDDWICIYDIDTLRSRSTWGQDVEKMIEANKDFDLLTCLATRSGMHPQRLNNQIYSVRDMVVLHNLCEKQYNTVQSFQAKQTNFPVAGFFLCFKKSLWKEFPFKKTPKGILSVDRRWSLRLLEAGKKIGICHKLVLIHYYRLHKNRKDTSHLLNTKLEAL